MDPATIQQNAYDQLRSAVLGSGLNLPEVSKFYAPEQNALNTQTASAGGNYNTGITVANQKAAAEEARLNQIDALKQQFQTIQDANDPSKYQRVPKDDGGFAFFDPSGKEISAWQYSRAVGKDPTEVLKGSQNPIDTQFSQDYNQLNQYIKDKQNAKNDPKARSRAQAVETEVRKLYGIKMHQQDPNEVIRAFQAAYPTVFGGRTAGRQGGSTLFPTNDTLKNRFSLGGGGL